MPITKDSLIYVAGHRGMVGSAVVGALERGGYHNLLLRTHSELDLTQQSAVHDFFFERRPEVVILAAARVGGIRANSTHPALFIRDNLLIQGDVIDAAQRAAVGKLVFLGSSCIYPKLAPQPIKEEYLLTGELEPTNEWYAIAKIAGIKLCQAYRKQFGFDAICLMPTNLYGPGDNYDLQTSHVLPALIRKFHEAKVNGDTVVTLWGTGAPRREFLYSDDLGAACVHLIEWAREELSPLFDDVHPPLINIGCGKDLPIRDLADIVRRIVGCKAEIVWDKTKPDGTPRKLLDVSKLT